MTLTVCWLRSVGKHSELVFASDSRLRAKGNWDGCPKLLTVPRTDVMIGFAGRTEFAYPMLLQIQTAIGAHKQSRDRVTDLSVLKGHVLRIFNQMWMELEPVRQRDEEYKDPAASFILGGYCWAAKEFKIWTLHFKGDIGPEGKPLPGMLTPQPPLGGFTFRPARPWRGISEGNRLLAVQGDAVDDFKNRLQRRLQVAGKQESGNFDMEPFEVLRDMIRENAHVAIGGPPQLAKVFPWMNTMKIGVVWGAGKKQIAIDGRICLQYERIEQPVIDPDTLKITNSWSVSLEETASDVEGEQDSDEDLSGSE